LARWRAGEVSWKIEKVQDVEVADTGVPCQVRKAHPGGGGEPLLHWAWAAGEITNAVAAASNATENLFMSSSPFLKAEDNWVSIDRPR
tara:strand:+ start:18711 stop:18974 length:264 start_codon:yes stop_codon:yes gene_type:complete